MQIIESDYGHDEQDERVDEADAIQQDEATPVDVSRREVRSLIFHLLYAAESFDYQESLNAIVDNFNRGFDLNIDFQGEVAQTAQQIIDQRDAIDQEYIPYLANWRFERIGTCTRLILRFAVWELRSTQTDPRIVINEAVELAKCFAEQDAYKFINGLLDRVAKGEKSETPLPS